MCTSLEPNMRMTYFIDVCYSNKITNVRPKYLIKKISLQHIMSPLICPDSWYIIFNRYQNMSIHLIRNISKISRGTKCNLNAQRHFHIIYYYEYQ